MISTWHKVSTRVNLPSAGCLLLRCVKGNCWINTKYYTLNKIKTHKGRLTLCVWFCYTGGLIMHHWLMSCSFNIAFPYPNINFRFVIYCFFASRELLFILYGHLSFAHTLYISDEQITNEWWKWQIMTVSMLSFKKGSNAPFPIVTELLQLQPESSHYFTKLLAPLTSHGWVNVTSWSEWQSLDLDVK